MSKIIHQLKHPSTFASHQTDPRASFLPSTFRPLTFGLLLTFHFSLLIFNSCGLDIEDPTPPSAPVWVQKSLPEEWPERGIDAHESGGIYIEWEPNPEEDIAAYLIYRAQFDEIDDRVGEFELISRLEFNSLPKLSYVDNNIKNRIIYVYRLRSEDDTGIQSIESVLVRYMHLPQSAVYDMLPNGQNDYLDISRKLFWSYYSRIEMEDYCLTITTSQNDLLLRENFQPNNYINQHEFWVIPDSVILESDEIYYWRIDIGAKYIDGYETAGSESHWAAFVYSGP